MRDLQDLFDRSAKAAGATVYWTTRTARLMVGIPDYETYVAHRRTNHPDKPIMTYVEFVRERQTQGEGGGLVEVQQKVQAKSEAKKPTQRADDPVRMYLRDMGSVELLSREGEIAIAKRIEAGREAMIAGLCESPLTFQAIIIWRDELNEGKIFLRSDDGRCRAGSDPERRRLTVLTRHQRIGVSLSERGPFQAEFQGRATHPTFYAIIAVSAGNPYPLAPKFFE